MIVFLAQKYFSTSSSLSTSLKQLMTTKLGEVCDSASGLKGWKVSLAPYKELSA